MGWRGAGGSGASDIGAYFFFGGLLMILGSLGEFIIGNTFPFVVFGTFGAFWLTFGATLQPFYMAYGLYATDPATDPYEGLDTQGFNASFAFFLLFMGLLCFVYFICSLRTNVVFMIIFLTLIPAFGCLAGAYWHMAEAFGAGATAAPPIANTLLVTAGALTFITDMCGWWIFLAIMLAALDFPIQIPGEFCCCCSFSFLSSFLPSFLPSLSLSMSPPSSPSLSFPLPIPPSLFLSLSPSLFLSFFRSSMLISITHSRRPLNIHQVRQRARKG